jgi:hypothetical protein
MDYEFTNEFLKDLKHFGPDSKFLQQLEAKINHTFNVTSIGRIDGFVPIRGTTTHYRFKIKTDKTIYRIGVKRIKKVIWFACIDNNKKRFYKRFP